MESGAPEYDSEMWQYTTVGGDDYEFDAAGNRTVKNDLEYVWNDRHQLVSITDTAPDPDEVIAEFEYDMLGRRVRSVIDGVETEFVWDGWRLAGSATAPAV